MATRRWPASIPIADALTDALTKAIQDAKLDHEAQSAQVGGAAGPP